MFGLLSLTFFVGFVGQAREVGGSDDSISSAVPRSEHFLPLAYS
jgi:hypothetical protein